MIDHQELIDIALDAGATKATVISANDVVLSATFRDICASNGCGMYGKCWMCPPDIGDIESLMAKVHQYKYGLVYQSIADIEDSFDIKCMQDAGYRDVKCKLYPGMRHEILNETNNRMVYEDLLGILNRWNV